MGKEAGLNSADVRRVAAGPDDSGWDSFESALLRAVDELHAECFIRDSTWKALTARYGTQHSDAILTRDLANAREFSQRAIDSARAADAKEAAAFRQANAALREAEFNNASSAQLQAQAALALAPGTSVRAQAALAMARAGHTAEARRLAEALTRNFPQDTIMQNYWLPSIWAAIELTRNNAGKAVELLRPATAYELCQPPGFFIGMMYPVYLRGQAYLQMRKGKEAAVEFQKFIEHRGIVLNFPTGALARLGLARAYALEGDSAKARTAYQDFLTLWKDADPDIPIRKQAKAEYAKLL
jgi:hypothetical protein